MLFLININITFGWDEPVFAIYEPPNFAINNQTNNSIGLRNNSAFAKYSHSSAISGKFNDIINCSRSDTVDRDLINISTGVNLGTDTNGNISSAFWLMLEPTILADRYIQEFRHPATDQASIQTTTDGIRIGGAGANQVLSTNRWYHICYQMDLAVGNCSLYIDGAFKTSATSCGATGSAYTEINYCDIERANGNGANIQLARIIILNNFAMNESICTKYNYSVTVAPDTTPPALSNFNLTSDGSDTTSPF